MPDAPALEPVFAALGDWARLNVHIWFLKTNLNSTQIYNALVKHITRDDSVAIIEVVPSTAQGWAPQWFWEWIAKDNTPSRGAFS